MAFPKKNVELETQMSVNPTEIKPIEAEIKPTEAEIPVATAYDVVLDPSFASAVGMTKNVPYRRDLKNQTEELVAIIKSKKDDLERDRRYDATLVRGRFDYKVMPGGTLEFFFCKYKGDPTIKYSLVVGQIYNLPRGTAKHLNDSGWIEVNEHCTDEYGNANFKIGKRVRRYEFHPVDFTDVGQYNEKSKELITSVKRLR